MDLFMSIASLELVSFPSIHRIELISPSQTLKRNKRCVIFSIITLFFFLHLPFISLFLQRDAMNDSLRVHIQGNRETRILPYSVSIPDDLRYQTRAPSIPDIAMKPQEVNYNSPLFLASLESETKKKKERPDRSPNESSSSKAWVPPPARKGWRKVRQ
jgi:hypothetical protein